MMSYRARHKFPYGHDALCIMLFCGICGVMDFSMLSSTSYWATTVRTLANQLFVLIQVRLGENQTDDGSHQHDAGPVHLRVLIAVLFLSRYASREDQYGIEKEAQASESHAKEALGCGCRWFEPNLAGR